MRWLPCASSRLCGRNVGVGHARRAVASCLPCGNRRLASPSISSGPETGLLALVDLRHSLAQLHPAVTGVISCHAENVVAIRCDIHIAASDHIQIVGRSALVIRWVGSLPTDGSSDRHRQIAPDVVRPRCRLTSPPASAHALMECGSSRSRRWNGSLPVTSRTLPIRHSHSMTYWLVGAPIMATGRESDVTALRGIVEPARLIALTAHVQQIRRCWLHQRYKVIAASLLNDIARPPPRRYCTSTVRTTV